MLALRCRRVEHQWGHALGALRSRAHFVKLRSLIPPLGLESGVVRVVDYDPRWPGLFLAEAARVERAIAPLTLELEHVGSTAISGLAAKPVLDILAAYGDEAERVNYIAALTAAGYQHRGEQGIPGREFFRRGHPRAYHLHLAIRASQFWHDHLDFRNLLRADIHARAEYGALKHALAIRYPHDREAYIDGKGAFVRAALDRWRRAREA